MLQGLNLNNQGGTKVGTGLNNQKTSIPLTSGNVPQQEQNMTQYKPKIWQTEQIPSFSNNFSSRIGGGWQGGGYFDVGESLNRQIEDLKRKEVKPNINFQQGFWGFGHSSPSLPLWGGVSQEIVNQWIFPSFGVGQPNQGFNLQQPNQPIELYKDPNQKLTLKEFGDKIKETYPSYENIDSEELGMKTLEKYPEYLDKVEFDTETPFQGWIKGGVSREGLNLGPGERINPLGKTMEEVDDLINKIGIIDLTKGREEALKQRLESLDQKELQQYKKEWEDLKKNKPRIANLYWKIVEGKTLVWKMRNIIRWKTTDLPDEIGFRNFVEEREKKFLDHLTGVGTDWPNFANMMANVPWSTLKLFSAIARATTNPFDTITGLTKLVFTQEGRQAIVDRYGSWEAFGKAMEQDPIGVASDALTLIQGGAWLAKWITNIAIGKGPIVSGLWKMGIQTAKVTGKNVGKLSKIWQKAENIGKIAKAWSEVGVVELGKKLNKSVQKKIDTIPENLSTVKKIAQGTKDYVTKAATNPLSLLVEGFNKTKGILPSAEWVIQRMNRLTKGEQAKFAQQQGKSVGERLNERGIVDTPENTIMKLSEYYQSNKKKVDVGLENIKGLHKNEMFDLMMDDTVRYAKQTLDPKTQRLVELQDKYKTKGGLEMSEINEVKRFFEQKNKFNYGRDMTAWEKSAWATNVDSAVRERQMKIAEENGFANLKEMNKETQASRFIIDKLTKNSQGKLGNNAMTLTDYIVAVPSLVDPKFITGLLGKKIISSDWFAKNYAKIVNKINWHKTQAEKVADLVNISKIQSEKDFRNRLYGDDTKKLPLKEGVGDTKTFIGPDKKPIVVNKKGQSTRQWNLNEILPENLKPEIKKDLSNLIDLNDKKKRLNSSKKTHGSYFGFENVKEIPDIGNKKIIKDYLKKGLTLKEIEAIQDYSISSTHNVKENLISKGLSKLDSYKGKVYRWDFFDLTKGKKVGDIIQTDRLMSTEINKNYFNKSPFRYEIESLNWKNLGKLNNKEFEVLFNKGTNFEIKGINKVGENKTIKLKELSNTNLNKNIGLSNLGKIKGSLEKSSYGKVSKRKNVDSGKISKVPSHSTSDFVNKFANENQDKIIKQYLKDEKNRLKGQLILNTDDFRVYLGSDTGVPSKINHEGSSFLKKTLRDDLIKNAKPGDKILMLGGAGGSGKGYSLKNFLNPEGYAWIEDKTFSKLDNITDYENLVKKGLKPEINFIFSPQKEARLGTIRRYVEQKSYGKKGRTVPFDPWSKSHNGQLLIMEELNKKGIDFKIHYNDWKGQPKQITYKELIELKNQKLTKEEATKILKDFKDNDGKGLTKTDISKFFALIMFANTVLGGEE